MIFLRKHIIPLRICPSFKIMFNNIVINIKCFINVSIGCIMTCGLDIPLLVDVASSRVHLSLYISLGNLIFIYTFFII